MQVLTNTGLVLNDSDPKAIMSLNLIESGLQSAKLGSEGKDGFLQEENTRKKIDQLNGYATEKGYGSFKGYGWVVLARWDSSQAVAAATSIRKFRGNNRTDGGHRHRCHRCLARPRYRQADSSDRHSMTLLRTAT